MPFTGKVLVCEEKVHLRRLLSLIVKSLGQHVLFEAADGEETLLLYQSVKPDLVLLDVNMRQRDGIQTIQALKQIDPDCLVVILTSLVNHLTAEECLRLGAADCLRKDLPREEIAVQLARIIDACFGDIPA
ncbi:MAG: response regulator [Opitutaceae bacterium]|nr:response regulator [Opitutaceae bacterium]